MEGKLKSLTRRKETRGHAALNMVETVICGQISLLLRFLVVLERRTTEMYSSAKSSYLIKLEAEYSLEMLATVH